MKNLIYKNDFEKAIYLLNVLDPSFLREKAGFKKDHISRLRKSDNIEFKTARKIINIQTDKLDLSTIETMFFNSKEHESWVKKIPYWENIVLLSINDMDDLRSFTLILMQNNINPSMIERLLGYLKKEDDKIVELIYENLYPEDRFRNILGAKRSFSLFNNLIAQLENQDGLSNYFNHDFSMECDFDMSKKQIAMQILNSIKNRDLMEEEIGESKTKDISWLITNFTKVDPLQIIAFSMIEQYLEFLNNEKYITEEVIYSDGTLGFETMGENQGYNLYKEFYLHPEGFSSELVNKLVQIGFFNRNEFLVFSFEGIG